MPFAPVNADGAQIEYEDTGAPPGSATYVTLFILHGGFFNNGVFRPLLPFAAENNVRILLPNARDIGKSTPYTEAELKAIQSKDKTLENAFMRDAVAELGSFFAWFVTHNDIPPFKEDARGKKTGGISLIGWSAAGDWFIPFFAMADAIPERIRATIEPYVRSLLTYDSPYYVIGHPDPPPQVYSPLRDPTLSEEQRTVDFPAWVSGYYSNHSPKIRAALKATSLDQLPTIEEFYNGVQSNHDKVGEGLAPTLLRIPKDTVAAMSETDSFVRSTLPVLYFHRELYAEWTRKLIFDADYAKKYFPMVYVRVIANMKGNVDCLLCSFLLKKKILERKAQGIDGRKMDVVLFENVNHMAHWDAPEETVKFFASVA